jgi:hypothetical protein
VRSRSRGAYSSGSMLLVEVEKSCALPAAGRLRFTVDYHL